MHVALDNVVFVRYEVLKVSGQEYAFTLARSFRLGDESLSAGLTLCVLFELLSEVTELSR